MEITNQRKEIQTMENNFMRVQDVMKELQISQSYAYKLMRTLNSELKELGYVTISGRVNKHFFLEKFCYNKEVK